MGDNVTVGQTKILCDLHQVSVSHNPGSCSGEISFVTGVRHLVVEEDGGGVFQDLWKHVLATDCWSYS